MDDTCFKSATSTLSNLPVDAVFPLATIDYGTEQLPRRREPERQWKRVWVPRQLGTQKALASPRDFSSAYWSEYHEQKYNGLRCLAVADFLNAPA